MEEEARCAKNINTDLKTFSHRETNCLINNGYDAGSKSFSGYLDAVEEYE
jgi:hypothetical protein